MPSRAKTSRSSSPASGSSAGTRCGLPSSTVTRAPNRANTWLSSTPTGLPPSTTSDPGTSVVSMASRLVQNGVPARPSIGRHGRLGAGVEQDAAAGPEHLVTHGDLVRRGEPPVAAEELAALGR